MLESERAGRARRGDPRLTARRRRVPTVHQSRGAIDGLRPLAPCPVHAHAVWPGRRGRAASQCALSHGHARTRAAAPRTSRRARPFAQRRRTPAGAAADDLQAGSASGWSRVERRRRSAPSTRSRADDAVARLLPIRGGDAYDVASPLSLRRARARSAHSLAAGESVADSAPIPAGCARGLAARHGSAVASTATRSASRARPWTSCCTSRRDLSRQTGARRPALAVGNDAGLLAERAARRGRRDAARRRGRPRAHQATARRARCATARVLDGVRRVRASSGAVSSAAGRRRGGRRSCPGRPCRAAARRARAARSWASRRRWS